MKIKNLGAFVHVSISKKEVESFNSSWPCSEIPARACFFEFQVKNGDLVSMSNHLMKIDGAEVAALADDAKEFWESNKN